MPVALALNLDATVLSLAPPTLANALHASTAQLQWFVSGYMLVFAAAMVPGGLLGDRFGRKRLLLVAPGIFAAGSVACASASSPGSFIAARLLLGLGAALATESRSAERPRIDAVGVGVSSAGLALVSYGVIEAGQQGWGRTPALLHSVKAAYVHGLDVMLLASAAVAAVGIPLALAFLPGRAPKRTVEPKRGPARGLVA